MKPMKRYNKYKDMCCYCGGVNRHKDKCTIRPIKEESKTNGGKNAEICIQWGRTNA